MRNEVEKKIHDVVHNHNEPLDLNNMWSKIEPQLVKPKKKKRPIVLFIIATVFTCVCLLLFFDSNYNVSNDKDTATKSKEILNYKASNPKAFSNHSQPSTHYDYHQTLKGNEAVNYQKIALQKSIGHASIPAVSIAKIKATYTKSKPDNASWEETIPLTNLKQNLSTNNKNQLNPENNIFDKLPSHYSKEETQKNTVNEIKDEKKPTDILMTIGNNKNEYEENNIAINRLTPYLIYNDSQNRLPIFLFKEVATKLTQNQPKPLSKQYFSCTFGYYLNNTTLSLKNLGSTNEYIQRAAKERPLDAISLAIKYHRTLYKNTSISIGLSALSIWDKSHFTDSIIEQVPLNNIVIDRVVTPDGTFETYGDQSKKRTTFYQTTSTNKYKFWSVPIDINYQIGQRKIVFDIGIGFDIIFHSQHQGKIFHADINYDLATDHSKIIASGLALRYNTTLGATYRFSKSIDFVFKSRYTIPSRNLFILSYGINQYQRLLGIETGLNYHF